MKEKILIYHVAGIGDTLVALPTFRMIRQNYPEAELHLLNISVVPSLVQAELYEHDTLFAKKIFLKSGSRLYFYWQYLLAVLRAPYSVLFCFSPSEPKVLTSLFRLFHGQKVYHCNPDLSRDNIMLVEGYLRKLESFGMKRGEHLFDFASTPEETQTALQLKQNLQNGKSIPLLAFGIGGKEDVCHWPLERYDELLQRLKQNFDFVPVYLGGPDERTAAQRFIQKHGGCFLLDSPCGTLRGTIAFLRHCACYIGNDTGSMHLAATAEIPCAAVFSAHDMPPMRWHPFSRNSFLLRHEMECSGCHLRTCRFGSPAKCLATISVDELYNALRNWLVLKEYFSQSRQQRD